MVVDTLPPQLARTRRFSLGHPARVTVSADGGTVFFLRSRAGDDPVSCLWAMDCATGSERCSPLLEAASLRRPLLLVHGLADDNVVPARTLRLSAALLAAGRPHEVLPLPRATHLPADEAVASNLLLHELDFLRRSLGVPAPRG